MFSLIFNVELMKDIKLFFLMFFFSSVYIACTNLCYIIGELTPEVLLFAEPRGILFLYKKCLLKNKIENKS